MAMAANMTLLARLGRTNELQGKKITVSLPR